MFRPVLIGQGPSALINRIDEQDVVRKGQKDALVMFLCAVKKDGEVEWSATYGGTPDSDFLKQELQRRISPAVNPRFIPAVHDHQLVDAIYYGTVTFFLTRKPVSWRRNTTSLDHNLSLEMDQALRDCIILRWKAGGFRWMAR